MLRVTRGGLTRSDNLKVVVGGFGLDMVAYLGNDHPASKAFAVTYATWVLGSIIWDVFTSPPKGVR